MPRARFQIAIIATTLFVPALRLSAATGEISEVCPLKSAAYDGYTISKLDLEDPTGFLTLFGSRFSALQNGLQLKVHGTFSFDKFNQDNDYLSARMLANFAFSRQRVKFSFARAQIYDCDPSTRTLRVVYAIFSNVASASLGSTIEEQTNEAARPAATGATRAADSGWLVVPLAGYSQTRGSLGGLSFSSQTNGFQIKGESEVSANSQSGHLDLGHPIGAATDFWNSAAWAATYEYLGTPAGAARIEEGKLTARFSASTKESTAVHMIFRYGGVLEGGHQQANDPQAPAGLLQNSAYGSLKLLAGVSGRPGDGAFTASYGLQLGRMMQSGAPTFQKHILDLGYNATFQLPCGAKAPDQEPAGGSGFFKGPLCATVHKSIDLETRWAGGLIVDASGAPLAERFLGGNQVRPFVTDDSWIIQSEPYIRSIRENQMGALSPVAGLGGSRFYSANATIAFHLWGLPMLPGDLAKDPQFLPILNGQFNTALTAIANSNKAKDQKAAGAFAAISKNATELAAAAKNLEDKLPEIPADVASQPATAQVLSSMRSELLNIRFGVPLIVANPNPTTAGTLANQSVPALEANVQKLIASLDAGSQAALASQMQSLLAPVTQSRKAIQASLAQIDSPIYVQQAQETLAPGIRALNVFLHQLNVYSVAPVAIFDVARDWPTGVGTRYAAGGGVRFTLAIANFTLAYAFNPSHNGAEPAGAVYFKLDVVNLFR